MSPWADDGTLAKITADSLWPELMAVAPMGRDQAMQVPPVARVRLMLAGTAARMPLVGMRDSDRMGEQPTVLRQPEPDRPAFQTRLWWLDSLFFFGRAWNVVVSRHPDGQVQQLRWVPEWVCEVDKAGHLKVQGDPVDPADVVRIDGPHDGILQFGQTALQRARAVELAASRGEDNPVPSVELHQSGGEALSDAQIDRLISRWAAARRGKNGGVAYTNAQIETKVHGAPAEQLLIAGRNAAALNLARVCGVPGWVVDASVQTSLNYSNTPSRNRELIDYGLAPYLAAIEARLSMDDVLPAGWWCRFDTTDLLRGDFNTRMQGYQTAIAAGVYSPDECRAMEQGVPVEDVPDATHVEDAIGGGRGSRPGSISPHLADVVPRCREDPDAGRGTSAAAHGRLGRP